MRSFYIASIILTVIVGMIIVNSFYVIGKIDELLDICTRLESDSTSTPADLELLEANWEDCRDIISLSINHAEIENAEIAINQIRAYYDNESVPEFHSSVKVLMIALDHISKAQKFSFDNIF